MASRLFGAPHGPGWTLLLGTVLALTACGGTASSGPSATASTPSAAPTTSSARATPTPTTSVTRTASPTPSPTRRADVAAAAAAALGLYARSSNNLNDPSAGYVWSAVSGALSTRLRDRLVWLGNHDYFDDRHCGEDYIDGNQVGLTRAPKAVSATANPDGTVTVVIRGYLNNDHRDLTVVMSQIHGTWLATDLRRGTGPNASIFSAHPNC